MALVDHPPAFMFYPSDFAADSKVEAMTTEAVGAYTLLLCKAWREEPPGSLPNDDFVLARWARLTSDRWTEIRLSVLAAFTLGKDSRWHQKRMRREFNQVIERRNAKSESGKRAAKSRWDSRLHADAMRTQCDRNADAMRNDAISSSSSSSIVNTSAPKFAPPTVQEVEAYCDERGNGIDAEAFVAYYTTAGWRTTRGPMKDWRSAIITWEKRDKASKPPPPESRVPTDEDLARWNPIDGGLR